MAPDVSYDPAEAQAVYNARNDFDSPANGGEPTGGVRNGELGPAVDSIGSLSTSTTSTAQTAGFVLSDDYSAGVHGHLGGSVVDEPTANGGYGDTQSLTQGREMYTVENNRIGVHDSPQGVLRFTMTHGRMSPSEAQSIQRNLNTSQQLFNRIGPAF